MALSITSLQYAICYPLGILTDVTCYSTCLFRKFIWFFPFNSLAQLSVSFNGLTKCVIQYWALEEGGEKGLSGL